MMKMVYPSLKPSLKKKVREVSKAEFKAPDEVIQESITRHASDVLSIRKYKEKLALDFLEGKLSFDDFARIVGYDNAKELLVAKETLSESVKSAVQDFKA